MASYQVPCFPVIYIDALSTKKVAAFEFFSLAGVVDPFRGAGPFLLCLAKYRADCPMNEICCDSDIFTIYQNETGFVKRSKVSVKANGSAGFAICFIGFSAQN